MLLWKTYHVAENKKRVIQDNAYCFGISESEYDKQIALPPTKVKGEGINLKN